MLSELDKKIVNLLVDGCSNIEIAKELGYSERSMYRKFSALLKKLGVKNKYELIQKITQRH